MITPTPDPAGPRAGRSDRSAQVLEAAAKCFSREGFHGASMASIAAEAAMSVGQIYRYFPSKEAVIAALVEQHLADRSRRLEDLRARAEDPVEQLLEMARHHTEKVREPRDAALSLEFLAEAARNPRIADILRTVDRAMREHVAQILAQAGVSDASQGSRIDLIMMLIDNWAIALMKRPDLSVEEYLQRLRDLFQSLLSCPDDC